MFCIDCDDLYVATLCLLSKNNAFVFHFWPRACMYNVFYIASDLTSEEITDLFGSVHKIAPLIEKQYGASALNIAVQVSVRGRVSHMNISVRVG